MRRHPPVREGTLVPAPITDGFELKRIGSSALSASNPEGRARSAAACRCPQVVRRPAGDVQKETVAFGCASQMPAITERTEVSMRKLLLAGFVCSIAVLPGAAYARDGLQMAALPDPPQVEVID